MSREYWWNDTWQGRIEVLGGKPALESLRPPQNPTWITLGLKPGLRDENTC